LVFLQQADPGNGLAYPTGSVPVCL